jgi:alanyl-tRNA synthetase
LRAATSQKCVRAGGKHNDLDNVGYTARHHTFFEMLGNFSFGDYFKDRAIELAWDLLTKEFGLDKDRLLVTVYHDRRRGRRSLEEDRGPCPTSGSSASRPTTISGRWATPVPAARAPRSSTTTATTSGAALRASRTRTATGSSRSGTSCSCSTSSFADERVDLPRQSIDTGMGLERIAALLQGKHDNYDIDLLRALIEASENATGVEAEGKAACSHRVIADHLRSTSFLIADGVLPSNEGRGYVLRRIMRRAMRHAHLLGAEDPLMYRLVPTLVREMGRAYPELARAQALITETLKLEESRFRKTLARGLSLLDEASGDLPEGAELDGETAFKLYDTYGFPLDLTQDALRARGITVDTDGFKAAMAARRPRRGQPGPARARRRPTPSGSTLKDRCGATDFLGYDTESAEGVVQALVRDGANPVELKAGETGIVILNQTPFYGESGGQVGDTGHHARRGRRDRGHRHAEEGRRSVPA